MYLIGVIWVLDYLITEDWAGKRARKYMFSIENLAWRDSIEFNNLPNAEKRNEWWKSYVVPTL